MALSLGTRLGSYEILGPLGAGGMGEVYRARDTKLGRDIALKVLPPEVVDDPARLRRFDQEARAASSLNHPSIVHVYDVGCSDSIHYIAMELVEGKGLRDVLASGPLPTKRLLDLGIEIADGLAKAHSAGIVHRDLKPENLIVSGEGHVKVLDFGIAKVAPSQSRGGQTVTVDLSTEPGVVLGTAAYMSPEQVSGLAVDFRSDQFSLGAVLYEMASGRRAFGGKSSAETLAAILRDEPESLARLSPAVPLALRRIVEERLLAKDPHERYASTWDLVRDLRSARDHLSDVTTPVVPPVPHARYRWLTGAMAAAALVALPLGYLGGTRSTNILAPKYRQISFGRGAILSARFAPDGETVLYGAAWEGRPVEPFLTRVGAPESRGLGFPKADVLAVSSLGEIAISLDRRYIADFQYAGTLARVALAGGSPRPVLEDVQYADWSPDGKSLAVVREVGGKTRLEYPIGTVLYEAAGWISHPRISPRDDWVAFIEHPTHNDDGGPVVVVDRSGKRKALTGPYYGSAQGLAWSPRGDEVWFTAVHTGEARALQAVTIAGVERTIEAVPGLLRLHDISKDGRVLLNREEERVGVRGLLAGSELDQDFSALDYSEVKDLSSDGGTLLIGEYGEGAPGGYAVYLHRTRTNTPPVFLGEGNPLSLVPDGQWVLGQNLSRKRRLILLPTGPGEVRYLKEGSLEYEGWGSFLPDGKRIVCLASEPGRADRLYVQDLEGSGLRPMSPEGVSVQVGSQPLSPDGAYVAAIGPDRKATIYPVEAGEARVIAGIEAGEVATRFTADGRSVFVFRPGELPARVFKVEIATGRRSLWKEIAPSDRVGLAGGISRVVLTPDGKYYAYDARRILSDLYVAQGLR